LDCGSPAAARFSQPALLAQCPKDLHQTNQHGQRESGSVLVNAKPASGSRAACRKRQDACRSPRSLRLGTVRQHLGLRQPCCRFSQPALLAQSPKDVPQTNQHGKRESGSALGNVKRVTRQEACRSPRSLRLGGSLSRGWVRFFSERI